MEQLYFETSELLRTWFEKNHQQETELFLGYFKKGTGKKSVTWPESVDQALCFGWIDGIRRSVDEERYFIRFTPRKPASIWSNVNINRVKELTEQGLMKPEGLAAFEKRKAHRSGIYVYESGSKISLSDEFEAEFLANGKAWTYFSAQRQSYRKTVINWVMTAKQQATQVKRLRELIEDSEQGRFIKSQRY